MRQISPKKHNLKPLETEKLPPVPSSLLVFRHQPVRTSSFSTFQFRNRCWHFFSWKRHVKKNILVPHPWDAWMKKNRAITPPFLPFSSCRYRTAVCSQDENIYHCVSPTFSQGETPGPSDNHSKKAVSAPLGKCTIQRIMLTRLNHTNSSSHEINYHQINFLEDQLKKVFYCTITGTKVYVVWTATWSSTSWPIQI